MINKYYIFLFFSLVWTNSFSSQEIEQGDTLTNPFDWGLTIDPSSILNYLGNANNGSVSVPVWNGLTADQVNISCVKFKSENRILRYGIGLSLNEMRSIELVQAIDSDGLPIDGEEVENDYRTSSINFGLRFASENFHGHNRLKARYGYFSGLSFSRQEYNFLSENPLETLIGDTLFYTPGRTFSFELGILTGASYFVTDNIYISGNLDLSMSIRDTRNSLLRQVAFDPVLSSEPFIANLKGLSRESVWDLGINYRPNLRLTFLF